jgi:hypothetical protein
LVQDPRPPISPLVQPHHLPHSHNHQHSSLAHGHNKPYEAPRRRMSDVRNTRPQHSFGYNQNTTTDSRPQQHVTGKQSYTDTPDNQFKRSASHSPRSPDLYTLAKSQSTITNGSSSRASSGNQSDSAASDTFSANEGHGSSSAASMGPRNDSMTGNHSKGRDQTSSRWSHGGAEASASGNTSGESSSRYSGTAVVGPRLLGGKTGGEGGDSRRVNGSGSSIPRNVQSPSDGVRSLPSLKASGLLDSWGSPWKTGSVEVRPMGGLQRPPSHVTPRRTSPPVANLSMLTVSQAVQSRSHSEVTDLRTLKAVPVGLPWLAKESR